MSKDNVFEASFLIYILFQDNFRSVSIFRRSLQIAGQEDWVGGVPDYDRSTSTTKGANSSQGKVLIERIFSFYLFRAFESFLLGRAARYEPHGQHDTFN